MKNMTPTARYSSKLKEKVFINMENESYKQTILCLQPKDLLISLSMGSAMPMSYSGYLIKGSSSLSTPVVESAPRITLITNTDKAFLNIAITFS